MPKYLIFAFMFLFKLSFSQDQLRDQSCLTDNEYRLYQLIMEYRKDKGLPAIPLSYSLSYVAGAHAWDLSTNQPDHGKCNMHSWSENGPWTGCCYTEDHKEADCLWSKPSELTDYDDFGYEVAYYSSKTVEQHADLPKAALEGWKKSPGHNHMIINKYGWKRMKWNAVGIGIFGNYAVVWFGEEKDKAGRPEPCP
jgi:uncharacterized protein YkwD